jgi:aromatic ring-opening dioxygenase catalytic subunit (LigB family)
MKIMSGDGTTPIIFIPHGGEPMPLLNEPNHRSLIHFLKSIGSKLGQPKAILIISAHWEADIAATSSTEYPEVIYDYHDFPAESYKLTYPAPGNPELARHVTQLINDQGLSAATNATRGLDHCTLVPLTLMFPLADISVVQLSLVNTLDAQHHTDIGKAIGKLREQGVLIVGSGFSFRNMDALQLDSDRQLHAQRHYPPRYVHQIHNNPVV